MDIAGELAIQDLFIEGIAEKDCKEFAETANPSSTIEMVGII